MVDNRHPRPRAGPPQPQPGQRLRPVGLPERTAGTPAGPGRLGEAIRRRAEALGGGAARRAPPQGARGGSVPSPLWCPRPVSAKAGPARDRPATAPRNASSGARPVPRRREDGASARGFYDRRNPPDQRFGDGLRHPARFSSMLLRVHRVASYRQGALRVERWRAQPCGGGRGHPVPATATARLGSCGCCGRGRHGAGPWVKPSACRTRSAPPEVAGDDTAETPVPLAERLEHRSGSLLPCNLPVCG